MAIFIFIQRTRRNDVAIFLTLWTLTASMISLFTPKQKPIVMITHMCRTNTFRRKVGTRAVVVGTNDTVVDRPVLKMI